MTETWTPEDTQTALAYWAEYQKVHDQSDRKGQTVGIDPKAKRVWFGTSATDIWHKQSMEGDSAHLLFLRVGYSYYRRYGLKLSRSFKSA